jgi:predicted nucleic-acid-binding protein
MHKIDANIILRYILNDHTELSPKAKGIIEQYSVEVTVEVLCEVVYVLTGYYKIDRKTVSTELENFIKQTQCIVPHQGVVLQAFKYFGETVLDFVDCILAGYAKVEKDEIHTFDKKLQKLIAKTEHP